MEKFSLSCKPGSQCFSKVTGMKQSFVESMEKDLFLNVNFEQFYQQRLMIS